MNFVFWNSFLDQHWLSLVLLKGSHFLCVDLMLILVSLLAQLWVVLPGYHGALCLTMYQNKAVSREVYIISPRCTTIGSPPNYIWAFLCFLCSLLLAEARSLTLPYAISIVLNIYHWSGAGPLGVLLPAGLIYNTKWGLGTSTLYEEDPPWRSDSRAVDSSE